MGFFIVYTLIMIFVVASFVDSQCPDCGLNGNCMQIGSSYKCSCKLGYLGSRCQLTDFCPTHPCGNNGACFPVTRNITFGTNSIEQVTYYCQCYNGFQGFNCQDRIISPCASRPCLNGGTCVNDQLNKSYSCICNDPYGGANCGTYKTSCFNNKCQNGALCVSIPYSDRYACSCANTGFRGTFCEIEINECESNPCKNGGVCHNLVNGYMCSCPDQFIGNNCETYISPCRSNPCPVAATCISNGNSYTCKCNSGYFGTNCLPNPCLSSPCRSFNSTCIPVDKGTMLAACSSSTSGYICMCSNFIGGEQLLYASSLC